MGTTVGFLIFLTLLLFSAQVLVHLYATSTLTSVASHAAEEVAYSPDPATEVPFAESDARRQMGSLGADATFTWGPLDGSNVVLRVSGRSPSLVPFLPGWSTITRTMTVRVERFR